MQKSKYGKQIANDGWKVWYWGWEPIIITKLILNYWVGWQVPKGLTYVQGITLIMVSQMMREMKKVYFFYKWPSRSIRKCPSATTLLDNLCIPGFAQDDKIS